MERYNLQLSIFCAVEEGLIVHVDNQITFRLAHDTHTPGSYENPTALRSTKHRRDSENMN